MKDVSVKNQKSTTPSQPNEVKIALRERIRKTLGDSLFLKIQKINYQFKYLLYSNFKKNAGYDRDYYHAQAASSEFTYRLFTQTLYAEFQPQTVVDIGCGGGGFSKAFMDLGCEVRAFDYSSDAIAVAQSRGVTLARQLDITKTDAIPAKGDLCTCLEVAEHLPETYARHLCQLLSTVAPNLAFTAAPPGQGGHLHVNEQPQCYWIERMESWGMRYDAEAVARIRQVFAGRMGADYDDNLMIFKKD
jgi:SAM-dependent methyltransferase